MIGSERDKYWEDFCHAQNAEWKKKFEEIGASYEKSCERIRNNYKEQQWWTAMFFTMVGFAAGFVVCAINRISH